MRVQLRAMTRPHRAEDIVGRRSSSGPRPAGGRGKQVAQALTAELELGFSIPWATGSHWRPLSGLGVRDRVHVGRSLGGLKWLRSGARGIKREWLTRAPASLKLALNPDFLGMQRGVPGQGERATCPKVGGMSVLNRVRSREDQLSRPPNNGDKSQGCWRERSCF